MILNEDNFLQYAMHIYDNPQCVTIEEFEDDLKRFTYLKKLFYRYKENNDLQERIILNHLIVLFNVFGDSAGKMLFFKMEKEIWNYLATFLVYLQRLPEEHISDFKLDELIIERLRKI
jgi:hypothetical protein